MKMYRNNEIFKDITIYFFTLPLLLLLFEFDKKKMVHQTYLQST